MLGAKYLYLEVRSAKGDPQQIVAQREQPAQTCVGKVNRRDTVLPAQHL